MARITAPNSDFTGERAGAQFTRGQAETSDPAALIYFRRHGYQVDDGNADDSDGGEQDAGDSDGTQDGEAFAPGEHTVDEVNDYLTRAADDERERVLAAEADGKARTGIIGKD